MMPQNTILYRLLDDRKNDDMCLRLDTIPQNVMDMTGRKRTKMGHDFLSAMVDQDRVVRTPRRSNNEPAIYTG